MQWTTGSRQSKLGIRFFIHNCSSEEGANGCDGLQAPDNPNSDPTSMYCKITPFLSTNPTSTTAGHTTSGSISGNNILTKISLMNNRGLIPRTLPTKVPYIANLLCDEAQLAFALTETWLADHSDAETQITGYTMYCQDQKRLRLGKKNGVAFYIRDDYAVSA